MHPRSISSSGLSLGNPEAFFEVSQRKVLVVDAMKDRRIIGERRQPPTAFLSRQTIFGGRRKTVRRENDRKAYLPVDHYGLRLFINLLLLLLLSVCDAYLTLTLVKKYNAAELNPIMALYLECGSITFFLEKFLFTSGAVFIFCLFYNFALTKISLALAITFYFGLVCYELIMMHNMIHNIHP